MMVAASQRMPSCREQAGRSRHGGPKPQGKNHANQKRFRPKRMPMSCFRAFIGKLLVLCAVGQMVAGSEPFQPDQPKRRIVYHDDCQSLQETPGTGASEFLRQFLRREVSQAPITTFCYLAAMPNICVYETKVGEVLGDRLSDEVLQIRLDENKVGGPSHILGIRGLRGNE